MRQAILNISAEKLFLADSMGALVTAILTGIVLPMFEDFFGMPPRALYILSGIAFTLFAYSLLCSFFAKEKARLLMTLIAILNFFYCCGTIALVVYHRATVTPWGWFYFTGEAFIIFLLVYVEVCKARTMP